MRFIGWILVAIVVGAVVTALALEAYLYYAFATLTSL